MVAKLKILLFIVIAVPILYFLNVSRIPNVLYPNVREKDGIRYYFDDYEAQACFLGNQKTFDQITEDVYKRLNNSPLYIRQDFKADVYFNKSQFLHALFSLFRTKSQAYTLWKLDGQISISSNSVCDRASDYTPNLIAHELTHKLLVDKLGKAQYAKMPVWLIEGYCDFISMSTAPFYKNIHEPEIYKDYYIATYYLIANGNNIALLAQNKHLNYHEILNDAKTKYGL